LLNLLLLLPGLPLGLSLELLLLNLLLLELLLPLNLLLLKLILVLPGLPLGLSLELLFLYLLLLELILPHCLNLLAVGLSLLLNLSPRGKPLITISLILLCARHHPRSRDHCDAHRYCPRPLSQPLLVHLPLLCPLKSILTASSYRNVGSKH
jgi:hypothetical protein